MTDLARNLGVFLRVYLPRDRRASRHTIESYKVSLKLLVLFAAERLSVRPCVIEVEQLTTQLILDFLDSLERERENTVATRNVRLAAIKALFRFLEYRSACYVDLSRQVHAIPKKAFRSEVDRLARAPRVAGSSRCARYPNCGRCAGSGDAPSCLCCRASGVGVDSATSRQSWPTRHRHCSGDGKRSA